MSKRSKPILCRRVIPRLPRPRCKDTAVISGRLLPRDECDSITLSQANACDAVSSRLREPLDGNRPVDRVAMFLVAGHARPNQIYPGSRHAGQNHYGCKRPHVWKFDFRRLCHGSNGRAPPGRRSLGRGQRQVHKQQPQTGFLYSTI